MNKKSLLSLVVLSFGVILAIWILVFVRQRPAQSQGQIINLGMGAGFIKSAKDDTKLYLWGPSIFNPFTNTVTIRENFSGYVWPSRLQDVVWSGNNAGTVVRKLNGTTLATLQTFQISPPVPQICRYFDIDWAEQYLYAYPDDVFDSMVYKFSLATGQLEVTSQPRMAGAISIPGTNYLWSWGPVIGDLTPYTYRDYGIEDMPESQAFRAGNSLQAYSPTTLTKVSDVYYGANNAAHGGFSDGFNLFVSPDGTRTYTVDTRGIRYPAGDGTRPHPDQYKYEGITCMIASSGEILWTLNKDDGFEGLNGNADFNLSGSLLVAVGGRGTGQAHFIKTATKEFVTLNVGLEDDSDVAVCTPKHTVYFSLPSQNALLEYPIPNGY